MLQPWGRVWSMVRWGDRGGFGGSAEPGAGRGGEGRRWREGGGKEVSGGTG